MLDYFSTFNVVQRQQRALFRALAQWQNAPATDLGKFGLSVTTEITNPRSSSVTVQFALHHEGGGIHQSGLVTFGHDEDGCDLHWLPNVTAPLLHEFLLPSAIAGDFRYAPEREAEFAGFDGGVGA
jgi:hypothetical protein